jgi:hypothetical protein
VTGPLPEGVVAPQLHQWNPPTTDFAHARASSVIVNPDFSASGAAIQPHTPAAFAHSTVAIGARR